MTLDEFFDRFPTAKSRLMRAAVFRIRQSGKRLHDFRAFGFERRGTRIYFTADDQDLIGFEMDELERPVN